jgi:hypothetical protein
MPGALQLEALAQMLTVAITTLPGLKGKVTHALQHTVRFRKEVLPGKKFEINAEVISWSRGICKGRGIATVDGEIACEADMLITIPDIRFVAAVSTSGVRAFGSSVAPATFSVKSKTSAKVTSKRVGTKAMITLKVSAAACAKYSCRVVVSSITSKVGSASKKISAIAVGKKSKSVLATVAAKSSKGQRLSVMLQTKKAGKWVYASSSVAKA